MHQGFPASQVSGIEVKHGKSRGLVLFQRVSHFTTDLSVFTAILGAIGSATFCFSAWCPGTILAPFGQLQPRNTLHSLAHALGGHHHRFPRSAVQASRRRLRRAPDANGPTGH